MFPPDQLLASDSSNAFSFGYAFLLFLETCFLKVCFFLSLLAMGGLSSSSAAAGLAELPFRGLEREHQGPSQMGVAMGNCV